MVQAGEVKNPKGRPKGSQNRGAQIKRLLAARSEEFNPITKSKEKLTQEQWCIIGMIGAARKGNTRAFEILMDGKYGPMLKNLGFGHNVDDPDNGKSDHITDTPFTIIDPKSGEHFELEIGADQ